MDSVARRNSGAGSRKKKKEVHLRAGVQKKSSPRFLILAIIVLVAIAGLGTAYSLFFTHGSGATLSASSTQATSFKWKILYVNQGNGRVNESNFGALLSTLRSHSFNALFFQVYRSGSLLFTTDQLSYFVTNSQKDNISIFFALYFTNSSQQIPSQIYGLGENGISLDMSTLTLQSEQILLSTLQQNYHAGKIAITTTNFQLGLKPDLLILETYDFSSDKQFIHQGIIAGVLPLSTQNKQDYESQVSYALNNSDGVLVFDYYVLITKGY